MNFFKIKVFMFSFNNFNKNMLLYYFKVSFERIKKIGYDEKIKN